MTAATLMQKTIAISQAYDQWTKIKSTPLCPDFVPPEWSERQHLQTLSTYAYKCASTLEQNGWCQGDWHIGHKSCALGVLLALAPGQIVFVLEQEAMKVIGSESIVTWNDEKGRTADDAIDMWLTVAANLEARASLLPV